MKRLLDYLPLHFTVLLIVGIVTQFYTHFWLFGFYKLLAILLFFSCLLVILKSKKNTTIGSLLLFFFIGVFAVYFNNDANYKNFYKHYLHDSSSVIFKVSKVLKSGDFYDKYHIEIIQVDTIKTRGCVLLNIHKDSLQRRLQVDEKIYLKPIFKELIPPLNPHQFNYKSYLAKQGIYQQVFIENNEYKKLGFAKFSLKGISAKFRKRIQESLKKYHFKDDELAVINALLLGQRQDISKELISDYSRAGAIHILAVSGLHVGIILLILLAIFKPLERLKKGKFLKAILIVVFLWMFAFIAGLSASVVRAVTMFTFLAVGQSFQQKNVIEFSLISSMFFLLLIKPMFLFDVSFQLSYLAVFGIVWVQPKLYKIWSPNFKIINKFWQLVTVSIAAQVGILPLSLYYFHQFQLI
ncbi:MAG: ComEC/Rec2 family competence protein [Polaribacter sp.]